MSNVHRIVWFAIMRVKLFLNWKFAEYTNSFHNITYIGESPPPPTPLRLPQLNGTLQANYMYWPIEQSHRWLGLKGWGGEYMYL